MRALVLLVAVAAGAAAQDGVQRFASLGDFRLEGGGTLRDCQIGYRTFGTLDASRSNAILVPTWFSGTSADLQGLVGAGKLFDSSRYFVIAVDSLGNGVSTSPSNSRRQPRMQFPIVSIRDMVESEYQLATRILALTHLKAVIGISMGGMQAFQWATAYPDFMDAVVPIVGSPRLAPFDLVLWHAEADAIRSDPVWKGGNYTEQPAKRLRFEFSQLLFSTPDRVNETLERRDVLAGIDRGATLPVFDANNHLRQSEAMLAHDIYAPFGGMVERAVAAVKARMLVVTSTSDHVVTPAPAREFARAAGAGLLELGGNCGHLAFTCEMVQLQAAVARFLEQ